MHFHSLSRSFLLSPLLRLITHQSCSACSCFVKLSCIIELTQKAELNNTWWSEYMAWLIQRLGSFSLVYFCKACIKILPACFFSLSLLWWFRQGFIWNVSVLMFRSIIKYEVTIQPAAMLSGFIFQIHLLASEESRTDMVRNQTCLMWASNPGPSCGQVTVLSS